MAHISFLPEALDDINEIDPASQRRVFKAICKLQTEPEKRGAPLGGELTTFRKLVVGNRQFRVVYRVESDGAVVVVWVVATRVDAQCYELAMARLDLYGRRDLVEGLRTVVTDVFRGDQ